MTGKRRVVGATATTLTAAIGALVVMAMIAWQWPAVGPTIPTTPTDPRTTGPAPVSSAPPPERLGLYAAAVRGRDGLLDVDATIATLRDVGATRFYYLIAEGKGSAATPSASVRDWRTLPDFADAAERVGIDVVVYLVPPLQSAADSYGPFGWDYRTWMRAVGRVARGHPGVVGVAIDDFAAATDGRTGSLGLPVLTPALVADGLRQARREAPGLRLYAVTYSQDHAAPTARLAPYRALLDGVIHAFTGPGNLRHERQNTTTTTGMTDVLRFVRRTTDCVGVPQCHQATFGGAGERGAVVELTRTIPASRRGVRLTVAFADDLLPSARHGYTVSVLMDGRPVPTRRVDERGRRRLVAALPASEDRVAVVVRIRRSAGSGPFTVWAAPSLAGSEPAPAATWTATGSPGTDRSLVRAIDVVLLVYAARFATEEHVAGAADVAYFRRVAGQAREAVVSGLVDGLVVYRLNLSGRRTGPLNGDPANFDVAKDLFRGLP